MNFLNKLYTHILFQDLRNQFPNHDLTFFSNCSWRKFIFQLLWLHLFLFIIKSLLELFQILIFKGIQLIQLEKIFKTSVFTEGNIEFIIDHAFLFLIFFCVCRFILKMWQCLFSGFFYIPLMGARFYWGQFFYFNHHRVKKLYLYMGEKNPSREIMIHKTLKNRFEGSANLIVRLDKTRFLIKDTPNYNRINSLLQNLF
jgi:hypothetical protein